MADDLSDPRPDVPGPDVPDPDMPDHDRHDHAHGHAHGLRVGDMHGRQRRVLIWALAVNAVLLVAEVIGGFAFGSLALLADAAHMLSDVAGLAIALVAQALMSRPHSDRHTYGLLRAEAMGAQANGVLLLASTVWIAIEAANRIGTPTDIDGAGLLWVASLGLIVNLGSAVALARVRDANLNIQGAWLHMMSDAAGSVAAIIAGIAVVAAGAAWVDPTVSLFIAVLVLWSAWRLLRQTTRVLMEAAPPHIDTSDVSEAIRTADGVEDVHHVHVWSISSDTTALSAHVVMRDEVDLHTAQERGDDIRGMLSAKFGIGHATLELECHNCEDFVISETSHDPAR